jgi:hypothetical protein
MLANHIYCLPVPLALEVIEFMPNLSKFCVIFFFTFLDVFDHPEQESAKKILVRACGWMDSIFVVDTITFFIELLSRNRVTN